MFGKPGYLKLTLRDRVQEERVDLPFLQSRTHIVFRDLIELIAAAREHRRIRALLLVVQPVSIGWAQIEELHQALDSFQKAGKAVHCYLEWASNQSYYLASGAQRIYLAPTAQLDLVGLRAEVLFFRHLLDSLGVEPELFNVGEYKSAGEIFTSDRMSDANRQMTDSILEDMQSRIVAVIARQRGVEEETVRNWINAGPYGPQRAVESGLVDELLYEDELEASLRKEIPSIRKIRPAKLRTHDGWLKRLLTWRRPRIAYLVAEGIVTQGPSRKALGKRATVGSETLRQFLKQARKNKRIQAIVLRINSPGGEALASDLIWREVQLARRVKPVIATFGNVAASGGYYFASAANVILALPGTLTGSIGVIGGKFSIQTLLSRLKIGVDFVDKGERSGYTSVTRPFTEAEARAVLSQIEEFYETFLKRVEGGRPLSPEKVREIAKGRVWTGSQALGHRLIDQIGGFSSAIEEARRQAGIPTGKRIRVVQYYRKRRLKDLLSLPRLESLEQTRVWALMPFWMRFR